MPTSLPPPGTFTTLGSVVPGIGNVVGAIADLGVGLFGQSAARRRNRRAQQQMEAARAAQIKSQQQGMLYNMMNSSDLTERQNFLNERKAEEQLAARGLYNTGSGAVDLSRQMGAAGAQALADFNAGNTSALGAMDYYRNVTPEARQQAELNYRQQVMANAQANAGQTSQANAELASLTTQEAAAAAQLNSLQSSPQARMAETFRNMGLPAGVGGANTVAAYDQAVQEQTAALASIRQQITDKRAAIAALGPAASVAPPTMDVGSSQAASQLGDLARQSTIQREQQINDFTQAVRSQNYAEAYTNLRTRLENQLSAAANRDALFVDLARRGASGVGAALNGIDWTPAASTQSPISQLSLGLGESPNYDYGSLLSSR